jgi:TM2 domain-containing membrane protein YozV
MIENLINPNRAAFYSLLFGPGAGQFLTNRPFRGLIYFSVFTVSLVTFIQRFLEVIEQYKGKLFTGNAEQLAQVLPQFMDSCFHLDMGNTANLMMILWAISIIDAWITARGDKASKLQDINLLYQGEPTEIEDKSEK